MHPFKFGISAHVSTDFWVLIEKPVNRAYYGKFTRCRAQNTLIFMKKRTAEKTVKLDTTVLSATCHAAVWMWLGVLQNLKHCVWQVALKRTKGCWTDQNNCTVTGPSIKEIPLEGLIRSKPDEQLVKSHHHFQSRQLTKEFTTSSKTGLANMATVCYCWNPCWNEKQPSSIMTLSDWVSRKLARPLGFRWRHTVPSSQPALKHQETECVNRVTNRIYYFCRNKTCQNLKIADCPKRICHQKLLFSWSLISAAAPSYRPDEQSFAAYNKISQKAEEELLQLLICQQQKNSNTDAETIMQSQTTAEPKVP